MTAIFLHIYYPHLSDDIIDKLESIPFEFNLYINLVENKSDHLASTFKALYPNAVINTSPNNGMDCGGQLRTLNYWLQHGKDEEFIIFLHTKKNDALRNEMWSIVLDREGAAQAAFNDPEVGMVGVQEWNLQYPVTPDCNIEQSERYGAPIHCCDYYCALLGLKNFEINKFGFIGGTMFLVRSSIFKKVFENVDIESIVSELPDYDNGGKIHALERIFGYVVLSEGYKIKGV